MGDWETFYLNDNNNLDHSRVKEAIYVKGTTQATNENLMVGAVSNVTDNFYTNRVVADSVAWCVENKSMVPYLSENKQDLYSNNSTLYFPSYVLSDYAIDWYDENAYYLTSTVHPLSTIVLLTHPLSCVTNNCSDNTSEIPFIGRWSLSDPYNKSMTTDTSSILSSNDDILTKNKLRVFPNPATNSIQIVCDDESIINYQLTDATGQVLRTITNEETRNLIDISNLDSGIFVILGVDASNSIKYQQRWVKL